MAYSLEHAEKDGLAKLKSVSDEAIEKNYTVIGLTASGEDMKQKIKAEYNLNFDFYLCDEKALKTIVRSNPGVLELNKGTVMQKVHWNDIEDLKLPEVEKKVEPKKEEPSDVGYYINGELSSKEEVEALDTLLIESVNVIKDSIQVKELNAKNNTSYNGIIDVMLKPEL